MPIINFAVPAQLNKQIIKTVKESGYSSKAELFRSLYISYNESKKKSVITEEDRFAFLSNALDKAILKKYKNKPIPSLKAQLDRI